MPFTTLNDEEEKELWRLSANYWGTVPGGPHRFEFVGKEPLALWIVVSLFFANTVLMPLPESAGKYILAQRAPGFAHWYATIRSQSSLFYWPRWVPSLSFIGSRSVTFGESSLSPLLPEYPFDGDGIDLFANPFCFEETIEGCPTAVRSLSLFPFLHRRSLSSKRPLSLHQCYFAVEIGLLFGVELQGHAAGCSDPLQHRERVARHSRFLRSGAPRISGMICSASRKGEPWISPQ